MKEKKLYSLPLSIYEIDLLHYRSNGSDKEYFTDALILKAVGENLEKIFDAADKEVLLELPKDKLEQMYLEMFDNEILPEILH